MGILAIAVLSGWGLWFTLGNSPRHYERMGMLELSRIAENEPDNFEVWKTLGLRLAGAGDAQLSEPSLRRALELKPNDSECATALGELLMATKRTPEAFQYLKLATSNAPTYAPGRTALARLYRKKGSYHHAAEQYEAVVAQDPKDSDSWYFLSWCYWDMQQVANAQNALKKAMEIDPKNPAYLMLHSNLLNATGQREEAIRVARETVNLVPKDLKIRANLVLLLIGQYRGEEDLKEIDSHISEIEKSAPDLAILPYVKAELASLRKDWNAAIPLYNEALRRSPERDQAYLGVSKALRRVGKTKEADIALGIHTKRQDTRRKIDAIQIAIGGTPDKANLYVKLAELQVQVDDVPSAIASLETALSLDSNLNAAKAQLQVLRAKQP